MVVGLGDMTEVEIGMQYANAAAAVTRDQCMAAITHQSPLDIQGQMACAQQGYSGNAAWPRPAAPPAPIYVPPSVAPEITLPPPPATPLITQPTVPEIVPPFVPASQSCAGSINQWIADNPLMAFGVVVATYFLFTSKR